MDKTAIRKQIQQRIEELETSLPGLKDAAQPVSLDDSIGRLSRMDAIGAQAINKKTYEVAKNKLSHLKRALENIDSDGFGLCSECEDPISPKRLLAVPESQLCIDCARNLGD